MEHFNIVDDIILDSMHLIYLGEKLQRLTNISVEVLIIIFFSTGVCEKLIEAVLYGITLKNVPSASTKRAISDNHLNVINTRLSELVEYYPCEFQRAPRSFKHLSYWRAHEFRQFLLYTWYTVLQDILPESSRSLFRLLHVFARILSDPSKVADDQNVDYATKIAQIFIAESCEAFGDQFAIYNVHGLLHVPEDVRRFGCLDEDSCFKFESFLYVLKHLVRSGRHPLKQAVNR